MRPTIKQTTKKKDDSCVPILTTRAAYENAMARWEYLHRTIYTIHMICRGLTREAYYDRNNVVADAAGKLLDEAYRQAFKAQELMFSLGLADPDLREKAKALAHRAYLRDNADMSWMRSHDMAPLSPCLSEDEARWEAMLKEMFGGTSDE